MAVAARAVGLVGGVLGLLAGSVALMIGVYGLGLLGVGLAALGCAGAGLAPSRPAPAAALLFVVGGAMLLNLSDWFLPAAVLTATAALLAALAAAGRWRAGRDIGL